MEPIDAFVTNKTSAKTLADGLRNGIRAMAEHYGFDYHDRLEWIVADKIDELISENKKLQAERDALMADIPKHCGTCRRFFKHEPCLDNADSCGWEWRGVQKEENDVSKT